MNNPIKISLAVEDILKISVPDWNRWMETARATDDPLYYSWRQLNGSSILRGDFSERLLCGGVFSDMKISGVSFRCCSLRAADFSNSCIDNTDFSGALLFGTRFTGSILSNCNFRGAQMYCCDFTGSKRVKTRMKPSWICRKTLYCLGYSDLYLAWHHTRQIYGDTSDRLIRVARRIRRRFN